MLKMIKNWLKGIILEASEEASFKYAEFRLELDNVPHLHFSLVVDGFTTEMRYVKGNTGCIAEATRYISSLGWEVITSMPFYGRRWVNEADDKERFCFLVRKKVK